MSSSFMETPLRHELITWWNWVQFYSHFIDKSSNASRVPQLVTWEWGFNFKLSETIMFNPGQGSLETTFEPQKNTDARAYHRCTELESSVEKPRHLYVWIELQIIPMCSWDREDCSFFSQMFSREVLLSWCFTWEINFRP